MFNEQTSNVLAWLQRPSAKTEPVYNVPLVLSLYRFSGCKWKVGLENHESNRVGVVHWLAHLNSNSRLIFMVLMETENVHWNNHICFTASSASLLQNSLHKRMTRHIVFCVFVVLMSFFYFCKDEHEMIPWKRIRPHFQSNFVPTSITNKII